MEYNLISTDNYKYLNAFIISDFIDMPVHIINNQGNIIFVNTAWSKAYNISKTDAVGKSIQTIMNDRLKYFLSLDEPNQLEENDYTYNHFDKINTQSTAIRALTERKKVSMITNSPVDNQFNRLFVTSTPVFDGKNEIVYVFTLVQDLTKISDWGEKLEAEIQKNRILTEEIKYYKKNQLRSKLIGDSNNIKEIQSLITNVATTDAPVLILGESGVGKEVLANEIYSHSNRKKKPFIAINCAAIPENLLESEMFGHEKGAFTGAVKSKVGLFELANGGTILLDEIGSMPLSLQPKLLRVLQEKEYMRVGGTKKIPLDVRIISATNENLFDLIKTGKFRQDLYYRLNVIPIRLPPLRERKEDIKLFCLKFLDEFNEKYKRNKVLNEKSLFLLEQYAWPGNIRELKNAIERLVIMSGKNVISSKHVLFITQPNEHHDLDSNESCFLDIEENLSLKEAVQSLERKLIQEALIKHKTTYNAAKALKTTQPTIVRKAKSLGIGKIWGE